MAAGVVPVPVRFTARELEKPLGETLSVPLDAPVALGVKVTLIVQLPWPVRELPQLLVWAKLLALVPVIVRLRELAVPLPLFFRVTVCAGLVMPTGWLPKERLVTERLICAGDVLEKLTVQEAVKATNAITAAGKIVAFGPTK